MLIKRVSFSTISSTALDAGSVGINSLAGKKDKKVKKEKIEEKTKSKFDNNKKYIYLIFQVIMIQQ